MEKFQLDALDHEIAQKQRAANELRERLNSLEIQLKTLQDFKHKLGFFPSINTSPKSNTAQRVEKNVGAQQLPLIPKSDFKPVWKEMMKRLVTIPGSVFSHKDIELLAKSMGYHPKGSIIRMTTAYYMRSPKLWLERVSPGVYRATDKARKELVER